MYYDLMMFSRNRDPSDRDHKITNNLGYLESSILRAIRQRRAKRVDQGVKKAFGNLDGTGIPAAGSEEIPPGGGKASFLLVGVIPHEDGGIQG